MGGQHIRMKPWECGWQHIRMEPWECGGQTHQNEAMNEAMGVQEAYTSE